MGRLTSTKGILALTELVEGENGALLRRLVDPGLDEGSPLLGGPPIYPDDIAGLSSTTIANTVVRAAATAANYELGPAVAAHELEDLAGVGEGEAPADAPVVEEVFGGGAREAELVEPVVRAVGEDQGGPLGVLAVARALVRLAREEGREVVFAGEDEGCGSGGGGRGLRGDDGVWGHGERGVRSCRCRCWCWA